MITKSLLILVDNNKIASFIQFMLEVNKEVPVYQIKKEDGEQEISCSELSKVYLLNVETENAHDLMLTWMEFNRGQPALIIDQGNYNWEKFEVAPKIFKGSLELCYQEMIGIVDSFEKDTLTFDDDEYLEYLVVSTSALTLFNPLCNDIYIGLKSGRKLKVFAKGSQFTESDVEHYKKRGVTKLCINKNDIFETNMVLENSVRIMKLSKDDFIDIEKFRSKLGAITKVVYDGVAPKIISEKFIEQPINYGYPFVIEKVHHALLRKITIAVIEKNLSTAPLDFHMDLLAKNKYALEFFKKRMGLMGNILLKVSKLMDWYSEETLELFLYACFTHDMMLFKDFELLGLPLAKEGTLTGDNKKIYLSHVDEVLELIKKDKKCPGKVDAIIGQHHEKIDGTGFPNGLNKHKIRPYSAAFILALNLCDYLIHTKIPNVNDYIINLSTEYKLGTFVKPLKALSDLCKEELRNPPIVHKQK